jgi:PEGA domain-containing protein
VISKGRTRVVELMVGMVAASAFLSLANAATRNNEMRVKVVNSETRSEAVEGGDVPKNCDGANFDAYCNNSNTRVLTNTLVVQEDDGTTFRVACTVDAKFSRCVPLPTGESFDARREKHGITLYYVDDKGKARSQLYTFVGGQRGVVASAAAGPSPAASASTPAARAAAPAAAANASAGHVSAHAAPATASAADDTGPDAGFSSSKVPSTVECSFSSTPAGADVTVDGRYVGSTPSVLGVATGSHVVVIKMNGFAEWKRELAIEPGSELTINAVLQKGQ